MKRKVLSVILTGAMVAGLAGTVSYTHLDVYKRQVISMPTLWNEGSGGNYSWQGGDSYPEYIRFRSGADKSVVNARIDLSLIHIYDRHSQWNPHLLL